MKETKNGGTNFETRYSNRDLCRDVWNLTKGYRGRLGAAFFLSFISELSGLYPAYVLAYAITFLSKYRQGDDLMPLWITLALITISIVVTSFAVKYYRRLGVVIKRIELNVEARSLDALLALGLAWHERESSGVKLKYIEKGASGVGRILRMLLNTGFRVIAGLFGSLAIIAYVDWKISLFAAGLMLLYFFMFHRMSRDFGKAEQQLNKEEGELSGVMFEGVNNIRTVKVLSLGSRVKEVMAEKAEACYQAFSRHLIVFQRRNWLWLFSHLGRMTGVLFVVFGVLEGRYELGFIVLFNNYAVNIMHIVESLASQVEELIMARAAVVRMQEVLAEAHVASQAEGRKAFPLQWSAISVKNLTFSYHQERVLDEVSFDIKRGEKIGIVGLSGAGKSTLFKLLMKEYGGYEGTITIDATPLELIGQKEYYKAAAVVLQDTELFNLSLRHNITLGITNKEIQEKRLNEALEIAHVDDFIEKLPDGLNTIIGEKGIKLSGGEKQRVGIARAVLKKPQILFLDEATSHLDLESEEKIQDSLHRFFKEVTAVVIAHRLTTIKEMDRILVLERGKIIETGSFTQLMKKKGRFFELWEKQRL